ncbi:MAG: histidinol-phosphate transaminase [Andreesenia angusta]|nr:histidinol-phosphate transaminase [Andreesenia angusta]
MPSKLFKKRVQNFEPYIPNEIDDCIKLDANESPFNLSVAVRENVMKRLNKVDYMHYPDTNADVLRESLSKYIDIPSKNIVVGNGSDEMIHVLLNTFVEPDDYVISHNPTFTMYGINTSILGGNYLEIPKSDKFKIKIDELIERANEKKAKVIMLCNPNNPTGVSTKREDIIRLLDETESIVVVDEAYIEFGGESIIDKVLEYKKLIVLRTFSKAFGAAAIRTGYLVSSEEIAKKIMAVKAPYNLNSLSQIIAEELLNDIQTIEDNIKIISAERNRVYNEIKNIEGIKAYESVANFILFEVKDAEKVFEELKKRGILIRLFKDGPLKNHLRMTIGSIYANQKFIDSIKEIIDEFDLK